MRGEGKRGNGDAVGLLSLERLVLNAEAVAMLTARVLDCPDRLVKYKCRAGSRSRTKL